VRRFAFPYLPAMFVFVVAGLLLSACSGHEQSVTPSGPTSLTAPGHLVTTVMNGTVADSRDAPISGAVVSAFVNRFPPAVTDETGHFTLSVEGSSGSSHFSLVASKDGYVSRTSSIDPARTQSIAIRLPTLGLVQMDTPMTSELLPTDLPQYMGEPYESDYSWNTSYFSVDRLGGADVTVELTWNGAAADALAMWAGDGTIRSEPSSTGALLHLPAVTHGFLLVGRPFAAGKLSGPVAFTITAHRDGAL